MTFKPQIAEQRFVLDHVVKIADLISDIDLINAVLEGAGQFAQR